MKERRTSTQSIHLIVAASMLMLAGTQARADDHEASGANTGQSSTTLDEVIVTARKREENLQNTPVSVTAFSAASLERKSLYNFSSLDNYVPNMEMNPGRTDAGPSSVQIFIRGVGQEDAAFPNEPGVGVYLDGVYEATSSAGNFAFLDLDRIEVLRGPQGTLYGKNTIGGAINVVTKPPDGDERYSFEAITGSYGRMDFTGTGDFALADDVFVNFAANSQSRNGYGHSLITGDEFGDIGKQMMRSSIRYAPGEDLDITLTADASRQRQHQGVGGTVGWYFDPNTPAASAAVAARYGLTGNLATFTSAYVNRVDITHDYNNYSTVDTADDNDIYGVALTIEKTFGSLSLKSISAFRHVDVHTVRDADRTPFHDITVTQNENDEQSSQEFQLSGTSFGDRLHYIVGLYALHFDGNNEYDAPVLDINPEDLDIHPHGTEQATSLAAYTEATYKFTDKWSLTLGGRVNRDDKDFEYSFSDGYPTTYPYYGVGRPWPSFSADVTHSWSNFLPKVNLQYQITDDVMSYAQWSKGYKAGGWNPRVWGTTVMQEFDPEYITTEEAGIKSSLFERRVTINADVFYSNYTNMQLTGLIACPGGVGVCTTVENAGASIINGAEVEVQARPIAPWVLVGSGGFTNARYTQLDASVVSSGVTLSDKFIETPKWTAELSSTYTWDLPMGATLAWEVDDSYKSTIYHSIQNFPTLITNPYSIVNTRFTYTTPSGLIDISIFGTNLTNKIYLTNGVGIASLGFDEGYYSRPIEWGLSFKKRFRPGK
jgi:iron complex outermembrane recepter protein